ncbi:hypothetical protein KBA63_02760 [Candidatus Woesebacteria bacterium]|nr:hypothetical protein [Candidatus Woesebacteria bacterium]MBP9687864.1 hypothetical protein [Candidatus Woesebacteria bacterium]
MAANGQFEATAVSAANVAMSAAYGVPEYAVGTWQRGEPVLVVQINVDVQTKTYNVWYEVNHDPQKGRKVRVELKQHHTGALYADVIVCYQGANKIFAGSLSVDGQVQSWQFDIRARDIYNK